ncbi:unnamed protein product [Alternaria burnsii]|nr:unnamed protein product [Alternaria burnsii]
MVLLLILSVWNAITVVCVIVGYYVSWVIYSRTLHPLAKVPGPVWPAVSRTWLMYRMYQGGLETHMRAIHNSGYFHYRGDCIALRRRLA